MRRIPQIGALMTPFPWHVEAGGVVGDARAMMSEHGLHHLPVTGDQHEVLGILRLSALPDTEEPLLDWMETVPCLESDTRADQVLEFMAESHQSVVVLTRNGHLAGILTWTDACRGFARHLREPFLPPDSDGVA